MGRFGGTDHNVRQMAMIAGIDRERGENRSVMWLRCVWAFHTRLVVGALWILRELMCSVLLLANNLDSRFQRDFVQVSRCAGVRQCLRY